MAENNRNYLDFQARERAKVAARRAINIFRQLHAIEAPLKEMNEKFLSLDSDAVALLPEMPGGVKLYSHIQNLAAGLTPLDKIDPDLLPFGEAVFEDKKLYRDYTDYDKETYVPAPPKVEFRHASDAPSPAADPMAAMWGALRAFDGSSEKLEAFKELPAVKSFGDNWRLEIAERIPMSALPDWERLGKLFEEMATLDDALGAWKAVSQFVKNPSPAARKAIAPMLSEYRARLALFGTAGETLKQRLDEVAGVS